MGKQQTHSSNVWNFAAHGDLASLLRCLDAGEEADLQNKLGESAAHLAARNGHSPVLLLLAQHGANPLLADAQGRTPVHAAAAAGQLECLRALAGPLGCRMDGKDAQGNTPLDVAKGDAVRKFLVNWAAESKSARRGGPAAAGVTAKGGRQGGRAQQGRDRQQQQQHGPKLAYSDSKEASEDEESCSMAFGQQQQQQQSKARPANDYHSSRDVEQQQQQQQQRDRQQRGRDAEGDGAEEGQGGVRVHTATAALVEAAASRKALPSTAPLKWAPLVRVSSDGSVRMPRCTFEETGFTPEGLSLGMPKRPEWRGVVRTAEELHALEERSFAAWQEGLHARQLPVSFYEPRLEFWRQLWRVLELSDVVIMIVDARSPLLHFSHALTLHVIQDHGAVLLLVLNKCDLVPPEAVHAWRAFFERRYPGLKVVAASTRSSTTDAAAEMAEAGMAGVGAEAGAAGADAAVTAAMPAGQASGAAVSDGRTGAAGSVDRGAAAAIMAAVLECPVWREGRGTIKVADVVGGSVDSILQEARRRSTLAKRAPVASASAIRQAAAAVAQTSWQGAHARGFAAPVSSEAESGDGSEEEEEDDWGRVKGTKASKKAAMRKKREKRMHRVGAAAAGGAPARQQQQQRQACSASVSMRGGQEVPVKAAKQQGSVGGRNGSKGRRSDEGEREGGGGDSEGARSSRSEREDWEGSGEEEREEGEEEGAEEEAGEDELAMQEAEELQREGQQQQQGQATASGQQQQGRRWHGRPGGAAGPQQQQQQQQPPVVVCVVGEPNVGKSSTLNSLLGVHRVAVSSHPGRTKHYQTHYMTDALLLCDCPGLVFPRTGVSLPMQILYGSYPIARCKDPYSVVTYLAERIWPRLHMSLGLKKPWAREQEQEQGNGHGARRVVGTAGGAGGSKAGEAQARHEGLEDEEWSTEQLLSAVAERKNWRSRQGRLDVYHAANWLLRAALAGRPGARLGFLPPAEGGAAAEERS